jgi:hypothetical protein
MKKSIIYFLGFTIVIFTTSCKKDSPAELVSKAGKVIEGEDAIITQNTEWKDLYGGDTIDYYVKAFVKIQKTAILTIKPGVHISFETPESGIRVEETGALDAEGTSVKPILFSSRAATNGAWMGIIFSSKNVSNKLDYVNVEYAGNAKDAGYCDEITSVGVAREARLSITNSTIKESGGYGLWVGVNGANITFAKNRITAAKRAPVALLAQNMASLDSLTDYGYNGENYIQVYDVLGSDITNDATIQRLSVPYRFSGRVHILKTLTIMPGCVFEFNTAGELTTTDYSGANHTGIIKAEGKTDNYKIFFKGVQSQPGSWVGITITSAGNNVFKNCEVSDAGASGGYANPSAAKGNFIVGRIGMGAKATIMN